MNSKKGIFKKNNDESSSADELLISPCFKVNPDVELKEVPTNGEEYLLKVMKERKNYSIVTKCNKDYSKFAKNQSCFIKEEARASVPDALKPTIEWQNIQVADFSEMRIYISKMRLKKPKDLKPVVIDPNTRSFWRNFFEENEPTLSCMIGINHTLLDNGLEVLIERMNTIKHGETIDEKLGRWIYAFLACLNQPLLSETVSLLRCLCRKCADIRSHISYEDEHFKTKVAPLNVFICLVARYFSQFDLVD